MSELTVFPDVEQRSPEWYEQRRGIVTASAVGQLVTARSKTAVEYECPSCHAQASAPCVSLRGADPIKTMHPERTKVAVARAERVIGSADGDTSRSLLMTLAAERITGVVEPTFTSEAMWRGIEDEPIAREHYAEHRAPVDTCGFAVRDFGKFKLGCSPDGLVGDDGLIEIKSRAPKAHLATVLSDQVPAANMAQCQAALLVFGREWLDYVSWCGGMPMWVIRVLPDPAWFDAITAAVEAAEKAIDGICTDYLTKVAGLPATERIDRELEMF